jgi:glycosyltransferase involved in cell wall biosynthesis
MTAFHFDSQMHDLSLRAGVAKPDCSTVFLMANGLEMGGTEKHLVQVATALKGGQFRVRLGCIQRRGYFAETLRTEWDIAEFRLGGSFFSRMALNSALALARHLNAHGVRVAHSFSFYSNLLMIPVARMSGVPIVIGSHRQLGDLLTQVQFDAQNAFLQLCDRIVCNSRAAAERLATWGLAPNRMVVIPNAVSPEIFRVGHTRSQVPSANVVKVGMIARMSAAGKNHALLLRAAAHLRSKSRNIQFFLVGDGPHRPQLESMSQKMGLTSQVTFLGECRDLGVLLANLDISVLASSSESSPNAITESMAAALPVVATRVGGIPELISNGETGLLVPVDDDVRLANAIEYLAENPEVCVRMGRNALEFAVQHFRLGHVSNLYERLYMDLLDGRRLNEDAIPREHRGTGPLGSLVGKLSSVVRPSS